MYMNVEIQMHIRSLDLYCICYDLTALGGYKTQSNSDRRLTGSRRKLKRADS